MTDNMQTKNPDCHTYELVQATTTKSGQKLQKYSKQNVECKDRCHQGLSIDLDVSEHTSIDKSKCEKLQYNSEAEIFSRPNFFTSMKYVT